MTDHRQSVSEFSKQASSLVRKAPIGIIILFVLVILSPYVLWQFHYFIGSKVETIESPRIEGMGIEQLLTQVKNELVATARRTRKDNEVPLFELKAFDLELGFVIQAQHTGKADVDYRLVTVSNETHVNTEKIQKIILRMIVIPPEAHSEVLDQRSYADDKVIVHGPVPSPKKQEPR